MAQRESLTRQYLLKRKPLLIVDKDGTIGSLLIAKINPVIPIVFVTNRTEKPRGSVVLIPYPGKIPHIPNNIYSYIFIVAPNLEPIAPLVRAFESKAIQDKCQLLFIFSLRDIPDSRHGLAELAKRHLVLVVGDLFGEHQYATRIQTILSEVGSGSLTVQGNGLSEIYPVLDSDVSEVILYLAEDQDVRFGLFLLYQKHTMTELTVARQLMKHDPDLTLLFSSQLDRPVAKLDGEHLFTNYSLFPKLMPYIKKEKKVAALPMPNRKVKRARPGVMRYVGISFFVLVLLPLSLFVISATSGLVLLSFAAKNVGQGDIAAAIGKAKVAQTTFLIAKPLGSYVGVFADLVGQHEAFAEAQNYLDGGGQATGIGIEALNSVQQLAALLHGTAVSKNDITTNVHEIKDALVKLQALQAENKLPPQVEAKIKNYQGDIDLLAGTADSYPWLLGFDHERKYLVLFQNNMELRPGGGFIGSYGIMHVKSAKLVSFQIHDVYDADGLLKGHIDPPFPLHRYVGVAHWFLRDSNFFMSNPANAANAERFLQLETGESVDGVIAIDVTILQKLLGVVGSVYVPDYKITVTGSNFYQLTESHAEDNFFPGSTQKKDFLLAVAKALQEKLFHPSNREAVGVLKAMKSALEEKDMLISVREKGVNELLSQNNLNGGVGAVSSRPGQDFLGVVDANVGANKANRSITKDIKQHVIIDEGGGVHEQVTIHYKNMSSSKTKFGGDYANYLRLAVPLGASLDAIAIDGDQVNIIPAITDPAIYAGSKFVPPVGLEVDTTQESGKTLYGFFISVPQLGERVIDISYTLPSLSFRQQQVGYAIDVFKQPGTSGDSYTATIAYPSKLTPLLLNDFIQGDGEVSYSGVLRTDKKLRVVFLPKS